MLLHHTTTYRGRYSSKCPLCSQRVQNGHFLITHVENQTESRILVNPEESIKYYSLLVYSTRIAFVCLNSANLSECLSDVKYSEYKTCTCSKESALLYNVANLNAIFTTNVYFSIGSVDTILFWLSTKVLEKLIDDHRRSICHLCVSVVSEYGAFVWCECEYG